MIFARRARSLLGFAFVVGFLYTVWSLSQAWDDFSQVVGMGDMVASPTSPSTIAWNVSNAGEGPWELDGSARRPHYVPGTPKPPGQTYTKTLVAARTKSEDTSWMERELHDWQLAVYVADDPKAPLHPPKNKGHEVMVYLTYVIDHYENLPDIMAFMHSHQFSWHHDEILAGNAVEMLHRLNPARVTREGYMNMRCIWAPGCPDWMHPGALQQDSEKEEETLLAQSWSEIFPDLDIPQVLAQPCCAQFAVSRERILAIPKAHFVHYRDWLLRTDLSDNISGRIWEYLWHVIFTGENVVCPMEHVCFCDGYGICFGGAQEYDYHRGIMFQKQDLEAELIKWRENANLIETARLKGTFDQESSHLTIPQPGRDIELMAEIDAREKILSDLMDKALARGTNPRLRAEEVGREWKEGDGF